MRRPLPTRDSTGGNRANADPHRAARREIRDFGGSDLGDCQGPVVELHLSNPDAREPWRHTSVVSPVADGLIAGLRGHGYVLAIEAAARLLEDRS